MIFQNILKVIFTIFLTKFLFKKTVINFINNTIIVLLMNFYISRIKIKNLQYIIAK